MAIFRVTDEETLIQLFEAACVCSDGLCGGCENLRSAVAALRERAEAAEHSMVRLLALAKPPNDYACAECKPNSEILQPGFRCAYHQATALRAGGTKP